MDVTETIKALPKVVLHDHLDGGLRPETIIELAAQTGYELPATDPQELGAWFSQAANSGSLVRDVETFGHTVAVMQTVEGLRRVAREMVEDHAADGAVYVESRWAPEQHVAGGLSLQEAFDAVQQGIDEGVAAVASRGGSIRVGQLVTAMRHADRWDEIADLALANRDRGAVGFDIAGAEYGFPPNRFPQVWRKLNDAGFPVTIHAGEADGIESISQAVHLGQALRIGHGVRITQDIEGFGTDNPRLGRVANWVRDNQIALEVCPCSNLQTDAALDADGNPLRELPQHPVSGLRDLDFAVTINTDNRLMSATSMSHEMARLVHEANWTFDDLRDVTLAAAWSAFIHHDERHELGERIIAQYEQVLGSQVLNRSL
jgi:adenosine deaminase